MPRIPRYLIFIGILAIVLASCSERACTIRKNNKKWNYYNGLQYGKSKR